MDIRGSSYNNQDERHKQQPNERSDVRNRSSRRQIILESPAKNTQPRDTGMAAVQRLNELMGQHKVFGTGEASSRHQEDSRLGWEGSSGALDQQDPQISLRSLEVLSTETDRIMKKTENMPWDQRWSIQQKFIERVSRESQDILENHHLRGEMADLYLEKSQYIIEKLYQLEAEKIMEYINSMEKNQKLQIQQKFLEFVEQAPQQIPQRVRDETIQILYTDEIQDIKIRTREMPQKQRWQMQQKFITSLDNYTQELKNKIIKNLYSNEIQQLTQETKSMPYHERWERHDQFLACMDKAFPQGSSQELKNDILKELYVDEIGQLTQETKSLSYHERWEIQDQFTERMNKAFPQASSQELKNNILKHLYDHEIQQLTRETKNMPYHEMCKRHDQFTERMNKAFPHAPSQELKNDILKHLYVDEREKLTEDIYNLSYHEMCKRHDQFTERMNKAFPQASSQELKNAILKELYHHERRQLTQETKSISYHERCKRHDQFAERMNKAFPHAPSQELKNGILKELYHHERQKLTQETNDMSYHKRWKIHDQFIERINKAFPQASSQELKNAILKELYKHERQQLIEETDSMSYHKGCKRHDQFIERMNKAFPQASSQELKNDILKHLYVNERGKLIEDIYNLSYHERFKRHDQFIKRMNKAFPQASSQELKNDILKHLYDDEINNLREKTRSMSYHEMWKRHDQFTERMNRAFPQASSQELKNNILKGLYDREIQQLTRETKSLPYHEMWKRHDQFTERMNKAFPHAPSQELKNDILKELYHHEIWQLTEETKSLPYHEGCKRHDQFTERMNKAFPHAPSQELKNNILKHLYDHEREKLTEDIYNLSYHERCEKHDQFTERMNRAFPQASSQELKNDILKELYVDEREKLTEDIYNLSYHERWEIQDQFTERMNKAFPQAFSQELKNAILKGLYDHERRKLIREAEDMPYHERWEIQDQFIERLNKTFTRKFSNIIAQELYCLERDRLTEETRNMFCKEQWEIHDKFVERVRNVSRSEVLLPLYHIESWRITEETRNKPYKEQWEMHDQFLARVPEQLRINSLPALYRAERWRIIKETENEPLSARWRIQREFIKRVPSELKDEILPELYHTERRRIIGEMKNIQNDYKKQILEGFLKDFIKRAHPEISHELEDEVKLALDRTESWNIKDEIKHTLSNYQEKREIVTGISLYELKTKTIQAFLPEKNLIMKEIEKMPRDQRWRIQQDFTKSVPSELRAEILKDFYNTEAKRLMEEIEKMPRDQRWPILQDFTKSVPSELRADILKDLCSTEAKRLTKEIQIEKMPRHRQWPIFQEWGECIPGELRAEILKDFYSTEAKWAKQEIKDMSRDSRWHNLQYFGRCVPPELRADILKDLCSTEAKRLMEETGIEKMPQDQRWPILQDFGERVPRELRADILKDLCSTEAKRLTKETEIEKMPRDQRWPILQELGERVPRELRADILKDLCSTEAKRLTKEIETENMPRDERWHIQQYFGECVPRELRADILKDLCSTEAKRLTKETGIEKMPRDQRWRIQQDLGERIPEELRAGILKDLCSTEAERLTKETEIEKMPQDQRWRILQELGERIPGELRAGILKDFYSTEAKLIMKEIEKMSADERRPILQDFGKCVVEELRAGVLKDVYITEAKRLTEETKSMPADKRLPILQKLRASVPKGSRVEILPEIYLLEGEHTKDLLVRFGNGHLLGNQKFESPGPQNNHEKQMVWYIVGKMIKKTLSRYEYLEEPQYSPKLQRLREWTIEKFEEWRQKPKDELMFEKGIEDS